MKVAELLANLTGLPPDFEVALSSDDEGNNFCLLDEVTLEDMYDTHNDLSTPMVVLWPDYDRRRLEAAD